MKINIIGLSGSGKTTLAKKLGEKLHLEITELDNLYYDINPVSKRPVDIPHQEFIDRVNRVIQKDDWIIEGVYPLEEIFSQADTIIWLKPSVYTSIMNQWKRFLQDKEQRATYGLKNNIKLTKRILKIYYGNPNLLPDKIKNTPLKKIELDLQKYKAKVIILSSRKDIDTFVNNYQSL